MSKIDKIYDDIITEVTRILTESRNGIVDYIEDNLTEWGGDLYGLLENYIDYELIDRIGEEIGNITELQDCLDIEIRVRER